MGLPPAGSVRTLAHRPGLAAFVRTPDWPYHRAGDGCSGAFTPVIEWGADHVPEKRMGVYGVGDDPHRLLSAVRTVLGEPAGHSRAIENVNTSRRRGGAEEEAEKNFNLIASRALLRASFVFSVAPW